MLCQAAASLHGSSPLRMEDEGQQEMLLFALCSPFRSNWNTFASSSPHLDDVWEIPECMAKLTPWRYIYVTIDQQPHKIT